MAEGLSKGMAEGEKKGMAEGKKQGERKGEKKMQEGIVLTMLKAGDLAIDKIAEYSGLKLSQVKKLAKTLA